MAVGIFYGSSGGATAEVAEMIKKRLDTDANLIDIAGASPNDFMRYSHMILGTSTWGDGDLQVDWEEFFETFQTIDLRGKTVALFGLGDQEEYSETFLDGMGTLYMQAVKNGAHIVGDAWPAP